MSKLINIVGAGLAGSITAAVLESYGHTVRIFDPGSNVSASEASSNLFVESWLNNITSGSVAKEGIQTLKDLYGPHIEYPFNKGLGYAMKVAHIPQRHILRKPDVHQKVIHAMTNGDVITEDGERHRADACVVAAGWLTDKFDPSIKMDVKVGHCVLLGGQIPEGESAIRIVSPYKHEKFYQFDRDLIYYADSVALKLKSYKKRKDEVLARTRKRAKALAPGLKELDMRVGYRPMTPGHAFGVFKRITGESFAITGGGKNGMVAYAVAAQKLALELS